MSLVSIERAIERISVASPSSPIAIFCTKSTTKVETLFADLKHVKERIKIDDSFIGIYHRHSNKKKTRSDLWMALRDTP